jgi:hypothetical protein
VQALKRLLWGRASGDEIYGSLAGVGDSSSRTHFHSLDINPAERALRGSVVGRKNHYGSKAKRGTEVAAILYSLGETAKVCGIDPKALHLVQAAGAAIGRPGSVVLPPIEAATLPAHPNTSYGPFSGLSRCPSNRGKLTALPGVVRLGVALRVETSLRPTAAAAQR